jgi:asparagine synthase (glutamine-hydrolysing)
LSGIGGDEMNGQALNPLIPIAELIAHGQLVKAGRQLFDWSLLTRTPYLVCLAAALGELLPMTMRARFSKFDLRQPWINRQFAKQYRMAARALEDVDGIWCLRPGPRDVLQTITTLSRELTRVVPSKLEHRYPYLDQDLVQFLTSIPFDQLLRGADRRSLMRRALVGIVPAEILLRRTKVSAARCFALTVCKHRDEIRESLTSSVAENMEFIDSDILQEHLRRLANGQGTETIAAILKALSLEFWLRDICARKSIKTQRRNLVTAERRNIAFDVSNLLSQERR